MANSHRRNNFIGSLSNGEDIGENQEEILEGIVQFYKNLLRTWSVRPLFSGFQFNTTDSDMKLWLEWTVDEDEVFDAVKNMNGDKAPGSNVFSIAFFLALLGSC